MSTELSPELKEIAGEVRQHARSCGLDFFEVIFELLDYDQLNMVVAYGGFPTRYPHWRFGMLFEELNKTYTYGLQKIYELVINNDPVVAYLVRSNSDLEQKLVMAHVFGHADFFKNNLWFSKTNRRMINADDNLKKVFGGKILCFVYNDITCIKRTTTKMSNRSHLDAFLLFKMVNLRFD